MVTTVSIKADAAKRKGKRKNERDGEKERGVLSAKRWCGGEAERAGVLNERISIASPTL